ncbi:MAG: bifunctional DNA-formamidopyrimidine glycosylase/DNA-(apurinic or apyrimidinic site) lyase [Burkholderiales bacterium]
MPELPEVETTRRGLEPHLIGQRIEGMTVRNRNLRWPVPRNLPALVRGRTVLALRRRGKYLLIDCGNGWLLLHLGMSGSLRVVPSRTPPGKHDHVDLLLGSGQAVRLTDPRRFGCVLWCGSDPVQHKLMATLGPEPLDGEFIAQWLYARTRGRRAPIKSVLMDSHAVAGIGNIYASEALFLARIHPATPARQLALKQCERLVSAVRETLLAAIAAGGSSLRNFVGSDGKPGYFQQQYAVYGRSGESCRICAAVIRNEAIGQRSSFFCPRCQRLPRLTGR